MYKIIKGEFRKGTVEGRAFFFLIFIFLFIYLFFYFFYFFVATAGIRA